MLELDRVTKLYDGRKAVEDLSLRVRRGELVGLFGRNGAGKSTTLRMAIGAVRPTRGTILFQGEPVTELPVYRRARKGLAYLSQERSVFRTMTVEENILAVLEPAESSPKKLRDYAAALLSEYGLEKLSLHRADTLTGGEVRRLELCRAMIPSPSILVMDEPFSGVDPMVVGELQGVIRSLRDRGVGILLADHNLRETLDLCDHAHILHEGRIVMSGTPDQIEGN
jgi:lipopolysaccharide export system ATP-binding protein